MILRPVSTPASVLLGILTAFAIQSASAQVSTPAAGNSIPAGFTTVIIPAGSGTWGYDIMKDGKLLIHQPTIPAVAGTRGFKDKGSAERTAALVIRKLERGEMPPTVSVEELENAGTYSRPE